MSMIIAEEIELNFEKFPELSHEVISILNNWDRFIKEDNQPNLLFRSRTFFEHLLHVDGNKNLKLISLKDNQGTLFALIPLKFCKAFLSFGSRKYFQDTVFLNAAHILSGIPIFFSTHLYEEVFKAVLNMNKTFSIIKMTGIPITSDIYDYVKKSSYIKEHFNIYIPHGARFCHTMTLPHSFDGYLKLFNKKKRYNLKRQVRQLSMLGNDSIELKEVSTPHDVDFLFESISYLSNINGNKKNTPFELQEFIDLASRNLLLCYVMLVGKKPCAIMIGKKFQSMLYIDTFFYDYSKWAYSPGTTLDFLMIEDLISKKNITKIDYGFGEPAYSFNTSHVLEERITLFLYKKSVANLALVTVHEQFNKAVKFFKNTKIFTLLNRCCP